MICIYKEMEKFLAMFLFKYFDTIQISCKIFFAITIEENIKSRNV